MICSKSRYDEKGNLTYRLTSEEKLFPEALEVEYGEYGMINQSLYDVIKNEDGKEFKKLKLRSEINYDDKGRVDKITTPESISVYQYTSKDIVVPCLEKAFKTKSQSHTRYLLKDEKGEPQKDDTTNYIIEASGSFEKDGSEIEFDAIRILKTYKADNPDVRIMEYYLLNGNNIVYYEQRDPQDKVNMYQISRFEDGKLLYINTRDFIESKITSVVFDYLEDIEEKYKDIFEMYRDTFYNTTKSVYDLESYEIEYIEESFYDFKDNEDGTVSVTSKTKQGDDEIVNSVTVLDRSGNVIKCKDYVDNTISDMSLNEDGNLYKMEVTHIGPKKITQFTRKIGDNLQNVNSYGPNKDIHLYTYSTYEDKIITTEYIRYPSGYITETVTVTENDKEVAKYITNNGEDYKVGVIFDALYNE